MNINNSNIFQPSSCIQEIEPETIRLKCEEEGESDFQMDQAQQRSSSDRLSDNDEKKMRRQIANSNERRRMQSINAGFQTLRHRLPQHEGEKLSKAAILQQTSEYIERLERDKNHYMAQAQHLQRLVDSLGGGNNNNNECPQQIITSPSAGSTTVGVLKKRKLDQVATAISDSSDEGLGSMSPEPVSQMMSGNGAAIINKTHLMNTTSVTTINVKDYVNLQKQMETERRHRIQLEEQLKNLEMQVYSNHQESAAKSKYQVAARDINCNDSDGQMETTIEDMNRQQSEIQFIPHHQYVVLRTTTPESSPKHRIMNDNDEDSRTLSSDELNKDEVKSMTLKVSPKLKAREIRIPSILEKAIKAEPKVEVERINSPLIQVHMIEEATILSPQRGSSPSICTTYPNSSHRPNLETIVEAIRHLEGEAFDLVDGQEQNQTIQKGQTISVQETPLALTSANKYPSNSGREPFIKFRQTATSQSGLPTFSVSVPTTQQQQRPGVIVVKQSS